MRAMLRFALIAVLCLLVLPTRAHAFATDGRGWWILADDAGQDGIHDIPIFINADNQAHSPLLQAAVDEWNNAWNAPPSPRAEVHPGERAPSSVGAGTKVHPGTRPSP